MKSLPSIAGMQARRALDDTLRYERVEHRAEEANVVRIARAALHGVGVVTAECSSRSPPLR